jgi:hypothetical protein
VSLPLCDCIGTRRASNIAASNPAAFVFGRRYRALKWLIIGQRPLDGEQFAIFIDDNQKELGLIHAVSHSILQLPQSSSASRFTAGASGFFILSQSGERPER